MERWAQGGSRVILLWFYHSVNINCLGTSFERGGKRKSFTAEAQRTRRRREERRDKPREEGGTKMGIEDGKKEERMNEGAARKGGVELRR